MLGWATQNLPFRELAYFIVCLAVGGKHLALRDRRRAFENGDYVGIPTENHPEGELELVGDLATGYHKLGLPIGSPLKLFKY